jgi:hypothetical protein
VLASGDPLTPNADYHRQFGDGLVTLEVGDMVWVGTHYRRIIEIDPEPLEDGRLSALCSDERDSGVYRMAITLKYESETPRGRSRPSKKREPGVRMTPEIRQKVQDGLMCRHGHDLTATLPNGKTALYVSASGARACRVCRQEQSYRRKSS